MKAVAAMVTPGGVLADVGTDHGYIPIALLQRQKIRGAVAMDINQGPLSRARQNIAAAHLESRIETRLSDGLQAMRPGEADTILIAGMGGELMIHILEEGQTVCEAASELILQPQSDIQKVREYLREHQYRIVDEDMVCEDNKYYPMMRAVRIEDDTVWEKMNEQTRIACDLYGPLLLRDGHMVLRRFLVREHRQLTQLLQQLSEHGDSEAIRRRIEEVEQKLQCNESAYTILGAIKNAGI
jgi:tRNA (adenine22-N1)-methyltransferase